jgi:DNA repair protein RecO
MKQLNTRAIVLSRTDYGEADRILTLLTPDHGKLSLMAKGVRRIKSKLAGGIELFSVSDITFIRGRGDVGTLISTRLLRHYGHIVSDVGRTMLGYELIKQLGKVTEDEPESEYFELLEEGFAALDNLDVGLDLIRLWFAAQLLQLGGHMPNLQSDIDGKKLTVQQHYTFSFDDMAFAPRPEGPFDADHIKLLRVGFAGNKPAVMQKIAGVDELTLDLLPLVQTMARTQLRW